MIDIDITKLRLDNGKTIVQQMECEARRFMDILQEEINIWYKSYTPVKYERTWKMQHSVYVDDYVLVDFDMSKLTISIRFTDDAFHKSLWKDSEVNVLLLMDNGFKVNSGWHQNIPYFGYRKGGYFLERTMARFNKENKFGITVEAEY